VAFIIPIIAAIGSAITAVATVIETGVAFIATGVGFTAGAAAAIGTAVADGVLLFGAMELVSLLAPQHSNLGSQAIAFKADPLAGVPLVIGRTGTGGNIVFADTSNDGHNKWLHYFTVLSHGPIDGFENFFANNIPVTFNANGSLANIGLVARGAYNPSTRYYVNDGVTYLSSTYICVRSTLGHDPSQTNYWAPAGSSLTPSWSGKMWQTRTVGLQPDSALLDIAGAGSVPEWTSANKLSGLCHIRWALQSDASAFPTGTPSPLWVLRGPPVYDPRLDSTYPGGSGSQRSNDATTWAWSENPYLHALTWLIGHRNNGVRVLGLGAPIAAIDVAAFVTGANVADANGWTCGGVVYSTDSKWDVFTQMLASGGGFPTRKGALVSCITDTPRVSIATLGGGDFVGAVSVQGMAARRDRINKCVYTYRSEQHQWSPIQADPITVSAYLAADGVIRSKGVQMPLVQDVNQGAQLARYYIEDSREFGPVTGPVKPVWMGLNPGDCITINEPEYGLNGQLMLIVDRKIDPSNGTATLTMRSETTGKHAFALGQTGNPPPAPGLTAVNLIAAAPNSPPWQAIGTTLTNSGVAMPAIVVTGTVENPAATNVIVRTRLSSGPGPWTHYDSPPAPVAGRIEITGLASGETRDIGLSYLVRGVQGAELVIASITAGAFAGSGAGSVVTPTPSVSWSAMSVTGTAPLSATSAAQTIGGITAPISLTLNFTGAGTLAYVKNGVSTTFTTGTTISVSAGDTLGFTASANSSASGTLTIINNSNAGATLATIAYTLTASGSSSNPSPTPVWSNISDITYASTPDVVNCGPVRILGIASAITLKFTFTGSGAFSYQINSGAWTPITSGGTFSVNPGDYVDWQGTQTAVGTASGVATVTNNTTATVLSTFTYALRVKTGPWP